MRRAARRGSRECVELSPGELFQSQMSEMIYMIISAGDEDAESYIEFTDMSVYGADDVSCELNVSTAVVRAEHVKDWGDCCERKFASARRAAKSERDLRGQLHVRAADTRHNDSEQVWPRDSVSCPSAAPRDCCSKSIARFIWSS